MVKWVFYEKTAVTRIELFDRYTTNRLPIVLSLEYVK
jgi:hypothetical protein